MKSLIWIFTLIGTLAFAYPCGNAANAPKAGYSKSVMGTLDYALGIMKLQEDPQIAMALQSYRMQIASIPSGMDTDAFKNGAFDREMFLRKSTQLQRANAQADLFEKLYTILDADQKQRLHQLMAAHQYYMGGVEQNARGMNTSCKCPGDGSCGCKAGQPCTCADGKSCGCDGKPANCGPMKCGPGKCGGAKTSCPPERNCPN